MTELQVQTRVIDGRKSLLEALQFLADRGVSPDVICLAMVRSGISPEVARGLAQCVVTSRPRLAAPRPAIEPDTGRAASLALRALARLLVIVVVLLGLGLVLGFNIGMEIGVAQGLERGIDQFHRLVAM